MSFNLYLSSMNFPNQDPSNLEYVFNPPVDLDGQYEMACVGGKVVNSIPNVSSKFNNDTLKYSVDDGATWKTVTFPEGSYQTTALETELRKELVLNDDVGEDPDTKETTYPIDFSANTYLLRFQVSLKAEVKLDLSEGELYKLLGFPSPIVLDGGVDGQSFTAPNIALFTTAGENFYIVTDIVHGGMAVGDGMSGLSGVIRAVESTGLGVVVSLRDPSGDYPYFPVNTPVLRRISIRSYDGLNRMANFRGEGTSFELRFRRIQ